MAINSGKTKFTVFVDESGQDTEGLFFVVGTVLVEGDVGMISDILETIERDSGKRNMKWHKARSESRRTYVEKIAEEGAFTGLVFVETFRGAGSYIELTALATAKAILKRVAMSDYKVTIFVDGLKRKEVENFTRVLRDLHIRTRKVRGVKKDGNNALIRFADAMCGLVRDAEDGNEWSVKVLRRLVRKGIVSEKTKPPLQGE